MDHWTCLPQSCLAWSTIGRSQCCERKKKLVLPLVLLGWLDFSRFYGDSLSDIRHMHMKRSFKCALIWLVRQGPSFHPQLSTNVVAIWMDLVVYLLVCAPVSFIGYCPALGPHPLGLYFVSLMVRLFSNELEFEHLSIVVWRSIVCFIRKNKSSICKFTQALQY